MVKANFKNIGEYKYFDKCRFCSGDIVKVIDLGFVPLAGNFLDKSYAKNNFAAEKLYPLRLNFCNSCYLLQVDSSINPKELFSKYYYFSSSIKTLVDHFEETSKELETYLPKNKKGFVVEIGCNDGSFINSVSKLGYDALGVDPAKNIVKLLIKKGYPIVNDFFSESLAEKIIKTHGKADAIYSFHSLAHIEDMLDVVRGIKLLLKPEGYLAFEVHYLGNLINEFQYDMIYHEHQFYYSLLSLKNLFDKYDMEIFNVRKVPLRAGSIIYYVQHKKTGKRKVQTTVKKILGQEKKQKLDKASTYLNFNKKIVKNKKDLLALLKKIKSEGYLLAGYGASGRGTVISNYCDLDKEYLEFVVDDAPAKHGLLTPGTHLPIFSADKLIKNNIRYTVLFAWPFIEEVKKRSINFTSKGGRFIVPLPKARIVK
ncbi:class I SAM-dependent methyltransferase [Patescibacteria group bacterium]|nr:class I SAM-dependent methyltransferase [Patescibacteria group bacterium]